MRLCAIILLNLVVQELVASHIDDTHESIDNSVGKLMDQALKMRPLYHADLEYTMLAKAHLDKNHGLPHSRPTFPAGGSSFPVPVPIPSKFHIPHSTTTFREGKEGTHSLPITHADRERAPPHSPLRFRSHVLQADWKFRDSKYLRLLPTLPPELPSSSLKVLLAEPPRLPGGLSWLHNQASES